jgi:hypothetical protein
MSTLSRLCLIIDNVFRLALFGSFLDQLPKKKVGVRMASWRNDSTRACRRESVLAPGADWLALFP